MTFVPNIILLIPEITKGMKSIGSKSLLSISKTDTIIDYQIKYIKKFYKDANIYVLTGFERDKVAKKIDRYNRYNNIKILYNDEYEQANHVDSLLKYIENHIPNNCLIINNGVLLKEKLQIDHNDSTVFTLSKHKDGFFVGVNLEHSSDSNISYLFYGLTKQWIECVFLNSLAINKIIELNKKQKLSNLFLFELLNLIIENGCSVLSKEVNKKDILKINTQDDLKKTKGFYDKNLFTKFK
jgi:hypothetical protein